MEPTPPSSFPQPGSYPQPSSFPPPPPMTTSLGDASWGTTLGGPPPPQAVSYAGWWRRVAATLIDGIVSLLFYVPSAILFGVSFADGHEGSCNEAGTEPYNCTYPNWSLFALALALGGVAALVYFVIYCRKTGRTGQTWGRKAMGYKIVDATTLQPIGAWKALGRVLLSWIINYACYIDMLWPLWDAKNQKLSDKALDAIAIKV